MSTETSSETPKKKTARKPRSSSKKSEPKTETPSESTPKPAETDSTESTATLLEINQMLQVTSGNKIQEISRQIQRGISTEQIASNVGVPKALVAHIRSQPADVKTF